MHFDLACKHVWQCVGQGNCPLSQVRRAEAKSHIVSLTWVVTYNGVTWLEGTAYWQWLPHERKKMCSVEGVHKTLWGSS